MEDEFFKEPQPEYSSGRKILLELKNILIDAAFPFILTLVISTTIILYASYTADVAVSVIALIGGEIMLIGSLVMFGRANGAAAYKKTLLNTQKRELGSKDESVVYRTGEYALWKGVVIPAIVCIPFLIFQTIGLCAPNKVCSFALQYAFGWAYYPFHYLGEGYEGLNYICVIIPLVAHTVGYVLGKLKQIKIQQQLAEGSQKKKGGRK